MTLENFTIKAQETVQEAVNSAQRAGQQSIEPVHLLNGLILKARDVVGYIFQKTGVNIAHIEQMIQSDIAHLPRVSGGSHPTRITYCSRLQTSPRRWVMSLWL